MISVKQNLYYSTNAGETFRNTIIDFSIKNYLELTPLDGYIFVIQDKTLNKIPVNGLEDTNQYNLSKLVNLPTNEIVLEMHISKKSVWLLTGVIGKAFLYRLSDDQKELKLTTSFDVDSPYLPYRNSLSSYKERVYIHKGFGTDKKILYSDDNGLSFQETVPVPDEFLGFFLGHIYYSSNKLFRSFDNGQNFFEYSKGIFDPYGLSLIFSGNEIYSLFIDGNWDQKTFLFSNTESESWPQINQLNGMKWAKNSMNQYLVIRNDSLFYLKGISSSLEYLAQFNVDSYSNIIYENNIFYLFTRGGNWFSIDNAITWEPINVALKENEYINSINFSDGKYVLSCNGSIWISDDGRNFKDITYNLQFGFEYAFYQQGKVFAHSSQFSYFEVLEMGSNIWQLKSHSYHIPFIFFASSALLPIGKNSIAISSPFFGFYTTIDDGDNWIEFNDGLDVIDVFHTSIDNDIAYCINSKGVWKRPLKELHGLVNTNDISKENDFSIYPNPTSDKVNIFSKPEIFVKQIKVYNENGKLVLNREIENGGFENQDISHLDPGVYYFIFKEDGKSLIKKVVKI
ncbi:MAG: T9SS type A sorting domain-containing protein [Saprospiraceae bacterium]|nr:T9SS type A sorting domain-containing protein [Saprospiraceae bacterium]